VLDFLAINDALWDRDDGIRFLGLKSRGGLNMLENSILGLAYRISGEVIDGSSPN